MKRFILPLCIGIVAAILYDTAFPIYRYFYTAHESKTNYGRGRATTVTKKTKREITKEVYEAKLDKGSAYGFTKEKSASIYMLLIGGAVTIGAASLLPNKRQ